MELALRLSPFIAALWMIIDVNYFLRTFCVILKSSLTRSRYPPGPFVSTTSWGICLPMDLDFNLHMNNGRYLRECDFARFKFWIESHLYGAVKKLCCDVTNRGNNIRYRRSILPFQTFKIQTKLVFWDEKSFYLEQRMIRHSDNFICAVNYCCQPVIPKDTARPVTPQQLLESLYGQVAIPDAPPELAAWIQSTKLSSQALYANTEI